MALPTQRNIIEMVFNIETTTAAAQMYLDPSLFPPHHTAQREILEPKPKLKKDRKCFPPLKHLHTMYAWRSEPVPLSLYVKPKGILQENPREKLLQLPHSCKAKDYTAIASRPRVVLAPTVSIDDMPRRARAVMVRDMYTTSYAAASDSGVQPSFNVQSPLPGTFAAANPLACHRPEQAFVSPEWRKESVTFDSKQPRFPCDHTTAFWLRKGPGDMDARTTKERHLVKQRRVGQHV